MSEPRNCFIYVLCFDTKLAHAKHYVGCTEHLRRRLITHARGHGSRLTRELHAQGISWRLGGLYATSRNEMKRLERELKNYNHSAQFCSICSGPGRQRSFSRKATLLSPDLFPDWTKSSIELGQTIPIHATTRADIDDMEIVKAIMKTERDALGFVPIGTRNGMEEQAAKGNVYIAWEYIAPEHAIPVGYLYSTFDHNSHEITIHQTCVLDAHRFQGHGQALVENVIAGKAGAKKVIANVRDDLAANHFWSAIGFQINEAKMHRTSGSLIHTYERTVEQ